MIKNLLKSSFRYISRNRLYSLINILGLSLALSSAMVMILFLRFELSYDKFFPDSDKIYRINTYWLTSEENQKFATAPPPLANFLKEDLPGNSSVTRLFQWNDFTMRPDNDLDNPFRETNLFIADADFFEVFKEQLVAGNPETALAEPGSIVLTESMARRYFGELSALKVLDHNLLGGKDAGTPWNITGVMKDLPENSHMGFDGLVSAWPEFTDSDNWAWNIMHTYIHVDDPSQLETLNLELETIVSNHAAPYMGMTASEMAAQGYEFRYELQPIQDIHLHSHLLREMKTNGNYDYVVVFFSALLLILFIAVINYTNLSIAVSANAAKEVGVKKVLGVSKREIVLQNFFHSTISIMISLLLSFGLVEVFLLNFSNLLGFKFSYNLFNDPLTLLFFGIATGMGMLAGLVPAIYFSSVKPASILKGKLQTSHKFVAFRNGLIIFQFAISILLILGTIVINQQVSFIQSHNPGFDKENVLIIQNDREIEDERESFKASLAENSSILNASFTTGLPAQLNYQMRDFTLEGRENSIGMNWYQADYSLAETMKFELIKGRWFEKDLASDSLAVVINESAWSELGVTDPLETTMTINKGQNDEKEVKIIGVVENFNSTSYSESIKPLVIENLHGFIFKDYVAIRIATGRTQEAFEIIKNTWMEFEPDVPFNYSYLDTNFDALFKSERKLSVTVTIFSIISIIIACMGLFGLASYSVMVRRKEVGIRKVLGATDSALLFNLSQQYLVLIFVAISIGTALGLFLMNTWLDTFVFKTRLTWTASLIPIVIVLLLSMMTVWFHALRAARESPVHVLRDE